MSFRILAINPGSTSTKVALYHDERPLLDLTLQHTAEQIGEFPTVADQLGWRREMILDALSEQGFDLRDLSAVIGRGGLTKPVPGGVYTVNEAMCHDLVHARMVHACNLGGLLAAEIAGMAGVSAYIADPPVVDEMEEKARITGLPECVRKPIFHALNQRAIARLHCRRKGRSYETGRLIVAHLGGGISVGAHAEGRIVDVNNALNGEGPIAPDRAGTLPAAQLADLCYSGRYTRAEIEKLLSGKGGLVAYLGTNSVQRVIEMAEEGNAQARLLLDAMCYTIAKQIGAMAVVLQGRVDDILLTGGIAYNTRITETIASYCSFIAPVTVYPGENELESLAFNALYVLRGELEPQEYV